MKKQLPEVEIYRLTQPRRYCRDYAHTDCTQYVCGTLTGMDRRSIKKYEKYTILDELMDFDRYTQSIEANTSATFTREDFPCEGINVIVIDCDLDDNDNPIQ